MKTYLKALGSYTNYHSRASRKFFWTFILWSFIILIPIIVAATLLKLATISLVIFYFLLHAIPIWSLAVRRLHDIGKKGWYLLYLLIPVIGLIITIIALCKKGDAEPNIYGMPPLD
jgi:uncharacterized membrane protein YhaH (DUF805 family)